jgi:hypothetical protein
MFFADTKMQVVTTTQTTCNTKHSAVSYTTSGMYTLQKMPDVDGEKPYSTARASTQHSWHNDWSPASSQGAIRRLGAARKQSRIMDLPSLKSAPNSAGKLVFLLGITNGLNPGRLDGRLTEFPALGTEQRPFSCLFRKVTFFSITHPAHSWSHCYIF